MNMNTLGTEAPVGDTVGVDVIPGILDEETLSHLLEVEFARARRYEHPFSLMRVHMCEPDRARVTQERRKAASNAATATQVARARSVGAKGSDAGPLGERDGRTSP